MSLFKEMGRQPIVPKEEWAVPSLNWEITRKEISNGLMFLAQRANGEIVGSALASLNEDELVLDSIQTNLGEREKGIGEALLAAVVGWGRRRGTKKLTGEFLPDCTVNPEDVINWYQKRGIKVDEEGYLNMSLE